MLNRAAVLIIFASAIPISKNLSGYFFAKFIVFVAVAKSASKTTIFGYFSPIFSLLFFFAKIVYHNEFIFAIHFILHFCISKNSSYIIFATIRKREDKALIERVSKNVNIHY